MKPFEDDDDVVVVTMTRGKMAIIRVHSISRIDCFQDPKLLGQLLAGQFQDLKRATHVE